MTFNEMAFFPSNLMLQNPHEDDHQPPTTQVNPFLPASCATHDIHGVASFLGKRSSISFSAGMDACLEEGNAEDELSDDGSPPGKKKRRLNMEQVKTLGKNFELGNNLEPERKMQLARALGLQPRQVATWFQNRRARWKTKQLEKDYDLLKRQFDAINAENDALQAQNQRLQAEISALRSREAPESINLNKETDQGSCINRSENSSEIKLDISRTPAAIDSPLSHHHPTSTCTSTSRPPFPSSSMRPTGHVTLPETHIQCQKNIDQTVKEESIDNLLCSIEDQSGFWPWLELQHHFN